MSKRMLVYLLSLVASCVPVVASAHEVYVLDHATATRAIAAVSPNPFDAFYTNQGRFFFWGFVAFITVTTVFFSSAFRTIETACLPLLRRLKKYAPAIERITLGISVIAFAHNDALFGPELPIDHIFGMYTGAVSIGLYAAGALIALGLFTRPAAGLVVLVSLCSIPVYGSYMLTYVAYFVVATAVLIMGSGRYSIDALLKRRESRYFATLRHRFEPYEMLAIRIGFGFSVMAAAFFAKFLHSQLALDTITQYHLTVYFPFEPLFIVLGALIIETLIGLFIMLGIELRWTALFFLFWLTLSLLYFGEAVWPHLALFGLNFMIFCHGYDRFTLEGRFFKKGALEPVL